MTNEKLSELLGIPIDTEIKLNIKEELPVIYIRLILLEAHFEALTEFCLDKLAGITGTDIKSLKNELEPKWLKHESKKIQKFVDQFKS